MENKISIACFVKIISNNRALYIATGGASKARNMFSNVFTIFMKIFWNQIYNLSVNSPIYIF